MKTISLKSRGFSLIELLVAVTLLSIVLMLVMQMVSQTSKTWKSAKATVGEFKDARIAFEVITRQLSQATLNTVWDYDKPTGVPEKFVRRSDLHFVCGPAEFLVGAQPPSGGGKVKRVSHSVFFQAPNGLTQKIDTTTNNFRFGGMSNLLSGIGYFVEFNSDIAERPEFLNSLDNKPKLRPRYRLIEFRQPSENLRVFSLNLGNSNTSVSPYVTTSKQLYSWFNGDNVKFCANCSTDNYPSGTAVSIDRTNQVLGENILALILLPCDTVDNNEDRARLSKSGLYLASTGYVYDSQGWRYKSGSSEVAEAKNVLPPLVDVTMVALDEGDFTRYARKHGGEVMDEPGLLKGGSGGELFRNPLNYDKDLEELKKSLSDTTKTNIQFKIFRATVRMRESKWSDYKLK